MKRCSIPVAALLAVLLPSPSSPHAPAADPKEEFNAVIKPFLTRHCFACHNTDTKKGNLQLDALALDFANQETSTHWEKVFDKLTRGEMPPPRKPRPPQGEVKAVTDWLRSNLHAASEARQAAEGRTVLRRLNRAEYENTVHDLLAVDVPLKQLLPEDNSAHGFDNVGAALDLSSVQMEGYLKAADAALDAALWHNTRPRLLKQRYSFKEEPRARPAIQRQWMRELDDAVVFWMKGGGAYRTELGQFRAPVAGRYRFRVSAYGYRSDGKPVVMGVRVGSVLVISGEVRLVGCFDMPPDKLRVIEFETWLEKGHSLMLLHVNSTCRAPQQIKSYTGPGLAVQWVETEGPLLDGWPPESYQRLFGSLPMQPAKTGGKSAEFTVGSAKPAEDAERLLREFTPRAFRRPVSEAELRPYVTLVKARLRQGYAFEEALRVGFKAVLCAPEFLFFKEAPGRLDDFAVASRLSYFLWSTPPDAELLALAKQGTLTRPDTLRAQVEWMLKSPKARALTENFLGQWLDLRSINFTTPDKQLYPEFDDELQLALPKETELFFEELLKNDLSVRNFIHSDFTMLNGRLAEHYGLADVTGEEFRKVTLPKESRRGGVLTHASVLKVTANGTTTSPVLRGKWVLERILGQPPDPPPNNVGSVEPDIRGTRTIREQLDKHRNSERCASCHRKIDPPGFALENYDVIGGWRDSYRTAGEGQRVTVAVNGRKVSYHTGPAVDASFTTVDGQPFRNLDEFKSLLLRDPEQVARCVTEKLLTYATGAGPQFADRAVVDDIVRRVKASDYGLRSIVHEVVQSKVFLSK